MTDLERRAKRAIRNGKIFSATFSLLVGATLFVLLIVHFDLPGRSLAERMIVEIFGQGASPKIVGISAFLFIAGLVFLGIFFVVDSYMTRESVSQEQRK